ncbi:hypothetical protein [Streptomyces sp. NPDC088719]|uniref:hypothetical protein n=1 Tax=Streptomyces sp. NPDC088719 TaxID=3365872 RepID=UPI003801430E
MQADQLKASSRKWITAALAAFSEGTESHDLAVHHAGRAAEHLLKAYLASLHPALIVEAKDFDSMLHATGHTALASFPLSRARTIGLVEAHSRVEKVLRGTLPIGKKALEPVASARNGVAHIGIHDVAEVQTVFTTCLRLIDPLLTELKVDPDAYWGSYQSLHDRLIEERVRAARIQLESRLAKSRVVFAQRYGHLRQADREVVLATITQHARAYMEHNVQRTCPACESDGWLIGDTYLDAAKNPPVVVFTPHIFTCSACDLEVEHEEFWELGDLSDEVELDDSPEDFYADWEPDPDTLPDDPEDPTIEANWEPEDDLFPR